MQFIQLIKKQAILFSAFFVILLIAVNTGVVFYSKSVLKRSTELQKESEEVKLLTERVWNQVVRNADTGMRGFALTKEEGLLGVFHYAMGSRGDLFSEIRRITAKQNFPRMATFDTLERAVDNYVGTVASMVELVRMDSMDRFREIMKQDAGAALWPVYDKTINAVNNFENSIYHEAVMATERANRQTMWIQCILFIIGIPTLLYMVYEIQKDRKAKKKLFLELENNNREYLFNPGTSIGLQNEKEIISNSIKNFKTATHFISEISAGNFEVDWEELNAQNRQLNTVNLAGELVEMREKMKKIKAEDKIRNWTNDGLTKFSEVIRNHQHDLQLLCDEVLVFITKYMDAQQGALFVVREGVQENPYLELLGCYALDRKKYINKRVEVGEGLVGQIYLEQKSEMYADIPDGYVLINSGLGETTPSCILIVPMIYNEKVEAVIEIASFNVFEKYQIEFMEKLGEIMASTLGGVKNNEKVTQLMEQFRVQAEQLKAQEEELRQNMEEMEATQEAIRRQEKNPQEEKL